MEKIKVSNKEHAYLMTTIIIIINFISVILPLFFLYTFPTSSMTNTFFTFPWFLVFIFGVIFLIYCIYTGVYFFEFKADSYIIEVRSRRTISSYFISKSNYLEMPISSIENFTFFNRPLTFNSTLMLKVRVSPRRVIAKRFNFSLLSKTKQDKIRSILKKIIQANRLDG